MYLVDTSVWIDAMKLKKNIKVNILNSIFDQGMSFGITSIIYQEILQGANSKQDFSKLANYFQTYKFYHPENKVETYIKAAEIYFNCRKKGLTIRKTNDCLIAQIAIENNLKLLHNDKDFDMIAKVCNKLKLA